MKKEKQLRYWNGRGQWEYNRQTFNIAAYSKAEACRLMQKATGTDCNFYTELNKYFFECWGNDMRGIEPTEPCLYVTDRMGNKPPIRLV